jgi:hypothetical protein
MGENKVVLLPLTSHVKQNKTKMYPSSKYTMFAVDIYKLLAVDIYKLHQVLLVTDLSIEILIAVNISNLRKLVGGDHKMPSI